LDRRLKLDPAIVSFFLKMDRQFRSGGAGDADDPENDSSNYTRHWKHDGLSLLMGVSEGQFMLIAAGVSFFR
jgi:hypothetical protein